MSLKITLFAVAAALVICGPVAHADWPMAGANASRTSWVSEEVDGPYRSTWYRAIEPYISQNVNLIAAEGKIFVSTSKGLYALDAADGSTEWVYATEMPLGHSPTYDNGVLYVGGFDRKLHCINASNGQRLWTYNGAKAGYRTNPVVADNLVLLGNRDGTFYAIHKDGTANEGTLAWSYPTGGPILYSAAYQNGVVFFCSMDMKCYALYTSNGTEKWVTPKLHGQGFHAWWPVIYRGYLVLTTCLNGRGGSPGWGSFGITYTDQYGTHPCGELINGIERECFYPETETWNEGDWIGTLGTEPGDWAAGTSTVDATRIMNHYADHPTWRARIFLDIDDGSDYSFSYGGSSGRYPPLATTGTKNGHQNPPVVSGYDDVIYAQNNYKYGSWICRGGYAGWKMGTPFISLAGGEGAVDEPRVASGGGRLLYESICGDREARARDLSLSGLGGTIWSYNIHTQNPGYDEMWFGAVNEGMYRLYGYYGSLNGVYHNLTGDQNPWIPYNGRLYIHRSNTVLCYSTVNSATHVPIASAQTAAPDTLVTFSENELKQMLEAEIQKWLDAGHLHTGFFNAGQYSVRNQYANLAQYFRNPAENIWVLLRALPHVNSTMQTNIRNFVQSEWNNYSPTSIGNVGWAAGASRDWFLYPPEIEADKANYPATTSNFIGMNIYGCWKYAQEFGGALTIYNAIKNKLPAASYDSSYPFLINDAIAGHWAYLELEAMAGQPETTSIRNALNDMLAYRVNNFQINTPWAADQSHYNRMTTARNFVWMTPELAGYMRSHILSTVQSALNEYEYVEPYWFVSRYEGCLQENTVRNLTDYFALFQAKAWILQESQEELVKYLDVPGFMRGDCFYLHNLISAIEASSSGNQAPYVDAGSNQSITLPDDDVSLNGTVTDDGLPNPPAATTQTWTKQSGPGTVSFGNANAVDTTATFSTDGVYVLRLTASDSSLQSWDEVTITVNPSSPTNQAPTVDAGSNQSITLPDDDVSLDGTVSDDGLPNPPGAVTQTWTRQSGPGTVTFSNANNVDTAATFSTDGVYVLRLTASDSALQAYDEVTITVNPESGTLTATAAANPTSGTAPLQVQFTGSASGGQGGGGPITGIIDNPGFEDGGGSLTGWTYQSNASLSSSGQGYGGGYAARLLMNPTGTGIISQQITTELTPDVEYTFTVKVKVISVGNGWTNSNGFRLGRYNNLDKYWESSEVNLSNPDWQTLSCTHTWSATDLDGGGTYPDGHFVHVGVILNRYDATTPTEILVDDFTISSGSGGPSYTYDWDFDNGDYSQDQNPLYTFNNSGTYNVELAVSDGYTIAYDYVTINVSPAADTTPPTPNPSTWATVPYATGTTSISMTATTASDPSGVEYYFDCTTAGGHDSAWQDSTSYTDTGLNELTQYTYRVQARDKSANQNTGGWSTAESATTEDGTAPAPNPSTWATVPYAVSDTAISMTATTASDPSGVQYYFDCTSGAGGHDSGWQSSATYQDTGLTPSTQYSYRVQTRDQSPNQNTGSWSTTQSAATQSGGTTLLTDGFETNFDKWTDGGTTDWDRATSQKYSGSYSAHAGSSDNDLISDNLNTTGYSSVTISFRYRDDDIDDSDDIYLQLYNGSSYVNNFELGITSPEDTWHYCETTINNSGGDAAYFISNFRIKFEGTSIDSGENLWIDDVLVTVQGTPPDTTPPTPNPLTWATAPYALGSTSISMTATTASDPSGVEYYFDCAAGGGHDSAWQTSPTYQDTGLSPNTQYSYRVQARDQSVNHNTGGWSTTEEATTNASVRLSGPVTVVNPSFELDNTGQPNTTKRPWDQVLGWTAGYYTGDSGVESTSPYTGAYDGAMLAYGMWDESAGQGDWWYQMLGETIVTGDRFTMTFAYGPTSVDMPITASFVYDNGSTLVEIASTVVSSGASKQLVDYTLVFDAQAGQAYIGENIGVKFAMGNGPQTYDSWASVDNVRVELVTADCVGWWKLDETSGTTASDSSASDNNGTLEGGPVWTSGALDLDGVDDDVTMPTFSMTGNTATFVAWINGVKASNWAGIVFSRNGDQACGMHFGGTGDNNLHYTWNNNDSATWSWTGGPAIPQNEWCMVAVVVEPTQATAYVCSSGSGVQSGVNSIAHLSQTVDALYLGYDINNTLRRFDGLIDNVRIYDTALSSQDISHLYQSGR